MLGSSKKTPVKIVTLNDLKFAQERFRHEVELHEQAIFSSLARTRYILVNNARQSLINFGQRLMIFSVVKFVRQRIKRRRERKEEELVHYE